MAEEYPERAWYVLYGYPGKEDVLRDRLRQRLDKSGLLDRLFDILIPTQGQDPIALVIEGKVHTVSPTLFPGAVFVLMAMSPTVWKVIRSTPGLTGFVGRGDQPLAYRPAAPTSAPSTPAAAEAQSAIQPGDRVRILSGPFRDFISVMIEVTADRAHLRVMVDFYGRPTPVEVEISQVKKE